MGILVMAVACLLGVGSCLDADQPDRRTLCECSLPPRCGTACTSECGCCPTSGSHCSSEGILRSSARGDCYDLIPCSAPNRCVVGAYGAVCAESTNDCEAVRAAYEAPLASRLITTVRSGSGPLPPGTYPSYCPEACQVSEGHCAQGLGTCWLLSYGPDQELDRLANLYRELDCPPFGTCNCPAKPSASCQYDSSRATASYSGPLTCMVE
jgi:hypothetical protein